MQSGRTGFIPVWLVIIITIGLILSGCRGCDQGTRPPDVSHLDGSFNLVRTEQILFAVDSLAHPEVFGELRNEHPVFWDLYFTHILQEPDTADAWRSAVSNLLLRHLADTAAVILGDIDDVVDELRRSFQYLQYYFPGNRVPNVYTLVSGFGYFPFIFEDGERDGLGISLEMFFGADFPYQEYVGNVEVFSEYLARSYNRDHLAKKTIDVLVDDLVGPRSGDRLIDQMIHNGKKLYILEHLMPGLPDTVLFEFTPAQLAWCYENERDIWIHLLGDDLLYSNQMLRIQKLVNYSPNVPGMPPEAPGRVANWTAWRILHALKRRNPSLRPLDLLSMRDAQAIVEAARYRPE